MGYEGVQEGVWGCKWGARGCKGGARGGKGGQGGCKGLSGERSLASGEKERLEQQWKKLKNLLMQLRKALGTLVCFRGEGGADSPTLRFLPTAPGSILPILRRGACILVPTCHRKHSRF